jgi:hypothetical protein
MEPTVQTDRTVHSNKTESIMCGNKQGTCMSINAAITGYRNVIKTEGKRILKYKYLTKEIQRMW